MNQFTKNLKIPLLLLLVISLSQSASDEILSSITEQENAKDSFTQQRN